MKGLLLKDFYALKTTIIMVGAMMALMIGVGLYTGGSMDMFIAYFMLFAAILPFTSVSLDERAGWNRYALTTRVSRGLIVKSKYLLGFMLTSFGTLMGVLLMLTNAGGTVDWLALGMNVCLSLVIQALSLPLMLRFGSEKARIILVVVALGISMFTMMSLSDIDISANPIMRQMHILVLMALVLYCISYMISMGIYKSKEFS